MNLEELINLNIIPRLKSYLLEIDEKQLDYQLDGIAVFKKLNIEDKFDVFLAGKLINVASFILSDVKKNNVTEYDKWKKVFHSCLSIALQLPMETWGILNFFAGLNKLKKSGIYQDVINEEVEQILKNKLDWRTFVRVSDLTLINKPTNYYGVAFAIAKYREIFGFEMPEYSEKLLAILLNHIQKHSSEYLFMDETAGDGRYDRYSCLIPGELAEHFHNFKMPKNEMIIKMLKCTSNIYLDLINNRGDGFMYGRSIGTYGDNSALEVLSISAVLKLLTEKEVKQVYGYSLAIVSKYLNFWIDKDINSLNMWEKGRRTDSYRHKGRILGENFSTSMQILGALEHFRELEIASQELTEKEIESLTKKEDKVRLYRYSDNRAMVVFRSKDLIFQLPIINGGKNYFDKAPYAPVPQMNQVLEMPPECNLPFFWPHFTLKDGRVVAPLCYYKNIQLTCQENASYLTFDIDGVSEVIPNTNLNSDDQSSTKCLASIPTFLNDITVQVKYTFSNISIEMTMTYQDSKNLISGANMLLGTFDSILSSSENEILFSHKIKKFSIKNLLLEFLTVENQWYYQTNHGRYQNIISCKLKNPNSKIIKWRIDF